jgi:hypothetical protein
MSPGASAGGRRGNSGRKPWFRERNRERPPDGDGQPRGDAQRRGGALARGDGRPRGDAQRRGRPPRDAGMTTAEYALGTVAACGFAAVLWAVVHSGAVHHLIQSVVERALNLPF